jgi:hypothetical protein
VGIKKVRGQFSKGIKGNLAISGNGSGPIGMGSGSLKKQGPEKGPAIQLIQIMTTSIVVIQIVRLKKNIAVTLIYKF